jgi:hypothetical protein
MNLFIRTQASIFYHNDEKCTNTPISHPIGKPGHQAWKLAPSMEFEPKNKELQLQIWNMNLGEWNLTHHIWNLVFQTST